MDGVGTSAVAEGEKEPMVMVLGATNFPWKIDEALRRRLEKRICKTTTKDRPSWFVDIPLPEPDSIGQLLKINLGTMQLSEDVDLEKLSARMKGYSGADITSVRVPYRLFLADNNRSAEMLQ